jgi:type I restriction-modification system DNA methylase subunit
VQMEPPKEIIELVERFEEHEEVYKNKDYKEAQLRVDFLNPFFNALGWDVYNTKSYDPEYREVVTEDRLVIGGETKAPDYSFRVTSRERKFFVEAKQPYVNIFADSKSAFQLRRYAYTASLPLSILTTFDRFSVYDCRPEPSKDDRATDACIKQLTYKDYLKEWDFIYKTFARESIFKGSFDKYARETKTKTVIKPFDEVFLSDIETWRKLLAEDIAKNNKDITEQELNKAVQLTIDRILFMRICETRGYEKFGGLQGLLNGENIYGRLIDRFKEADKKYNSGLFHFYKEENREHFDGLSLTLSIGDGIFKQIFKRLYYPDCPYEYSVIEADILGSIYERFLGNVIYLSKDHQAKVDQKPEVRKAGGVYYTPSYIVKYIVENTVGKLVEGKTPEEVSKLRICDPACGSGSFLLEAFHFLLEWHHKYYLANKPAEIFKKKGSPLVMTADGNYKLSLAERKRILVNNIYGVDIDAQAVEVTKLSLLLKVIESLLPADLLDKRILPDLGTNIKCGNSLIGTDFFEGKGTEDWNKIRPFDWDVEFPEIFKNGGFDAVIGNPPYIRIQTMKEWASDQVDFFKKAYKSASKGNYDIYVVFIEKGLSLLGSKGLLGMILPHKFFNAQYGEAIREVISSGNHLSKVVHFGDQQVFENATTYTTLLFLGKTGSKSCVVEKISDLEKWRQLGESETGETNSDNISSSEWNFSIGNKCDLFVKLSNIPTKLEDITSRIFQGIKTGSDKVFIVNNLFDEGGHIRVLSKQTNKDYLLEKSLLHSLIKGGDSKRYSIHHSDKLIIFPYLKLNGNKTILIPIEKFINDFPNTWSYLNENKTALEMRDNGDLRGGNWYGYSRIQALDVINCPKIFTPDIAIKSSLSFDKSGNTFFTGGVAGGYGILSEIYSLQFLLGYLNSKLLEWFLHQYSTTMRGGYYSYESRFIKNLPIRTIDFNNKKDVERHDMVVRLVERMLELNKRLQEAKTPDDKELLSRQIEATDRQIDALVYELYELTPEEIAIVEESAK